MTPDIPDELRKDLGARVKAVRKAKRWKREALAEEFGVTVSAWGQWERGDRMMNLPAVLEFARKTEVSLDYFYLGDERRLPLEIAEIIIPRVVRFRNRA